MQRHRHERVDVARGVAQLFDQGERQRAAEPARAAVLQSVHVAVERGRIDVRSPQALHVPSASAARTARDRPAEAAAPAPDGDAP